MSEGTPPFLRRVVLRNYKSIRECDVTLGPLTFLVGPNGSGKSNFLEALRYVSDSLRTTMAHVVGEHGDVRHIFWRGPAGDSQDFSVRLELSLRDGSEASYRISVTTDTQWLFVIEEESCSVSSRGAGTAEFHVKRGQVVATTIPTPPLASPDQLYLTNVSGYAEFSKVHELLKGMRFYNIDPEQIRKEASAGQPAREMLRNGRGALFAAHRLFQKHCHEGSEVWARMQEYLRAILPMLEGVCVETTVTHVGLQGSYYTRGKHEDAFTGEPRSLKFRLWTESASQPSARACGKPLPLGVQNISDGTLRAFGVLLALFQCVDRPEHDPIPLVGIEEPEATLHPAAAGVLFDALHEASHFTQVLVTTHSAELLDIKDLDPDSLLVVDLANGETIIGPADEVSLSAMKDRMYTAGELLEMNQLRANPRPVQEAGAGSGGGSSALPPNSA